MLVTAVRVGPAVSKLRIPVINSKVVDLRMNREEVPLQQFRPRSW